MSAVKVDACDELYSDPNQQSYMVSSSVHCQKWKCKNWLTTATQPTATSSFSDCKKSETFQQVVCNKVNTLRACTVRSSNKNCFGGF